LKASSDARARNDVGIQQHWRASVCGVAFSHCMLALHTPMRTHMQSVQPTRQSDTHKNTQKQSTPQAPTERVNILQQQGHANARPFAIAATLPMRLRRLFASNFIFIQACLGIHTRGGHAGHISRKCPCTFPCSTSATAPCTCVTALLPSTAAGLELFYTSGTAAPRRRDNPLPVCVCVCACVRACACVCVLCCVTRATARGARTSSPGKGLAHRV
jgi:hypothetical protein